MKQERPGNVRDVTKQASEACFDIKLGDQNEIWALHKGCKNCTDTLRLVKDNEIWCVYGLVGTNKLSR